jgi:glycosyltransferase involved in cell wall biosynthesis
MTSEITRLKRKLAEYERNSTKTAWLLRQLWRKVRFFPRDLSRRIRRSIEKRRAAKRIATTLEGGAISTSIAEPARLEDHPFVVSQQHLSRFEVALAKDEASRCFVTETRSFLASQEFDELVSRAAALDPDVGRIVASDKSYCPPFYDKDYSRLRDAIEAIPSGDYEYVILMPAGRMGGADLVAAMVARALSTGGRTLILRTDDSTWDRQDWYPPDVPNIDVSVCILAVQDPPRALYSLLSFLRPAKIININSRLGLDTFMRYGSRLAIQMRLYAYFFCADHDENGIESGYPVWYFSHIFNSLTAAIFDARDLSRTLTHRFRIPPEDMSKMRVIYTPSNLGARQEPLTRSVRERATERRSVFWAGRLDRQKRFDLVVSVAREMPDVDFSCWGKAVLDPPPDLGRLPANLKLHAPFKDYSDLPLADCDLWLYTSSWDGLPTILIELGALGIPIAASAAGGVPELIDESTGWLFPIDAESGLVASTIRTILADDAARYARARALQERVRARHDFSTFSEEIRSI